MSKTIYYIGMFIIFLIIIVGLICRIVFDSNLFGMQPTDFVIIGMLLFIVINVWSKLKDNSQSV